MTMSGFLRLVIHEYPEAHPDETEGTDDHECHLPAASDSDVLEILCKKRNGCRSYESTYGCTRIED